MNIPEKSQKSPAISRTVVILGVVSMLTDISSEGIYPLIPLFLINVMDVQVTALGLIEGVAESTACILRVFSGWLSDRMRNRKWITVAGYGLSTISKPMLFAATNWTHVFAVRFADRLGKGIRSAPRDALIADVSSKDIRGISFGLHRAMDTVGAIVGPLLAFWLLRSFGLSFRQIFLLSAIPAMLAVIILVSFVREPKHNIESAHTPALRLKGFGPRFNAFLLVSLVFSFGNFSDAFLILRANQIGISPANLLIVYLVFNAVEALLATSAGAVSDRIGRWRVIAAGYAVFSLVYAGFGLAKSPQTIWMLFGVYGLYSALTHGTQKAFAADLLAPSLRGTGLGAYQTLTGLILLPASLIAGFLWKSAGASAAFYFGAGMALTAALLLVTLLKPTYTDT